MKSAVLLLLVCCLTVGCTPYKSKAERDREEEAARAERERAAKGQPKPGDWMWDKGNRKNPLEQPAQPSK